MDIISHGLWGGIAVGRRSRRNYWLAFLFGIAPDLVSFGVYFLAIFLGLSPRPAFRMEPPQDNFIPGYVHSLYNFSHSLVIFLLAFLIVFLIFRRPIYEMLAWGLHIVVDIFTHSNAFFPTHFIWPISDYHFNGIPWSHPIIFIPDVILLVILYLWWYLYKIRKK